MIVSYAWTTDALLCGDKWVTRRGWAPQTAAKFLPGTSHKAASKVLYAGGEVVGYVRAKSVRLEPLARLIEDPAYGRAEWLAEGGPWYWRDAAEFIAIFQPKPTKSKKPRKAVTEMYRFEFELLYLTKRGEVLKAAALLRRPAFYTSK